MGPVVNLFQNVGVNLSVGNPWNHGRTLLREFQIQSFGVLIFWDQSTPGGNSPTVDSGDSEAQKKTTSWNWIFQPVPSAFLVHIFHVCIHVKKYIYIYIHTMVTSISPFFRKPHSRERICVSQNNRGAGCTTRTKVRNK